MTRLAGKAAVTAFLYASYAAVIALSLAFLANIFWFIVPAVSAGGTPSRRSVMVALLTPVAMLTLALAYFAPEAVRTSRRRPPSDLAEATTGVATGYLGCLVLCVGGSLASLVVGIPLAVLFSRLRG
ncbi:MAG: hypothetical protein U0531_06000 [Dehalococcoidia bacterium]